jgi:hypothetical protein
VVGGRDEGFGVGDAEWPGLTVVVRPAGVAGGLDVNEGVPDPVAPAVLPADPLGAGAGFEPDADSSVELADTVPEPAADEAPAFTWLADEEQETVVKQTRTAHTTAVLTQCRRGCIAGLLDVFVRRVHPDGTPVRGPSGGASANAASRSRKVGSDARLYHTTSGFIRLDDLRGPVIVDLPVISITIACPPVAQPTLPRRRISPKEGTDRPVTLTATLVKPFTDTLGSPAGHRASRELVKSATSSVSRAHPSRNWHKPAW